MAQIGLNILATGFSGKLLIQWSRASAPLVEVGRSAAFDFPYDDVYTITDLAPVVYIVRLWRSDDGVSLDQLIKDWSIDASKQTTTSVRTFQYKVGRGDGDSGVWADPGDGDSSLIDTRLDGFTKDQMLVHEDGFGNWLNERFDLIPGGGIMLLEDYVFNQDTGWFITVYDLETSTLPADTGSGDLFRDVVLMAANHDFDEDHYNALVIADGAGTSLIETIPDLSLIPDATHVTFNAQKGSQNYLRLQFDVGDTVRFQGRDVNVIDLEKGASISLYFKGGVCYVTNYSGKNNQRGSVQWDYDNNRDADTGALLFADETTGELNKADYLGLYDYVAQLTDDAICPLGNDPGEWNYLTGGIYPNRCKFGIDDTAETFRVPHLSGLSVKGGVAGTREGDAVGPFTVDIRSGTGGGNTNPLNNGGGPVPNVGFSGMDNFGDWLPNGLPGVEKLIRPSAGSPQETRVRSVLLKPYIIL